MTKEDYAEAAANGIDRDMLEHLFYERGWSKKKSISPKTPVAKDNPTGRGRFMTKERREWLAVALSNDIPEKTFLRRLSDKMPIEEAATKPRDMSKVNTGRAKKNGQTPEENAERHAAYAPV
ncbi:MAG: hypothetical protein ABS894_00910 [Aerococcus urinaeequi]